MEYPWSAWFCRSGQKKWSIWQISDFEINNTERHIRKSELQLFNQCICLKNKNSNMYVHTEEAAFVQQPELHCSSWTLITVSNFHVISTCVLPPKFNVNKISRWLPNYLSNTEIRDMHCKSYYQWTSDLHKILLTS